MYVRESVHNLLENELAVLFLQSTPLLDQFEQVTSTSILHHHQQMLGRFKDFKETNDVGVLDLL